MSEPRGAGSGGIRPPRLYAIADRDAFSPRRLPEVVEALAQAGVRWIQLRAKGASGADLMELATESMRRLEGAEVVLWLNDRVDVAACVGMSAVHLGQTDLPPAQARLLLGAGAWIGHSTHDRAQATAAAADSAVDVIAVGPVFATASKSDPDPVVGLELVRQARALTRRPLVAIGGISPGNASQVLEAGADTVAVISALAGAPRLEQAARHLLGSLGESAWR